MAQGRWPRPRPRSSCVSGAVLGSATSGLDSARGISWPAGSDTGAPERPGDRRTEKGVFLFAPSGALVVSQRSPIFHPRATLRFMEFALDVSCLWRTRGPCAPKDGSRGRRAAAPRGCRLPNTSLFISLVFSFLAEKILVPSLILYIKSSLLK